MRLLNLLFFIVSVSACSQSLAELCHQFDTLYTHIRDQDMDTAITKNNFRILIQSIKKQSLSFKNTAGIWIFPLQGYNSKFIGGKNGEGYIPQGYDFFIGNNHKAHPAHDIFIHDFNQDCIDDNKKKYINVLSVTEGIVVAYCDQWDTTSTLRGGKYIWIYSPSEDALFYYAHLNSVFVDIGDIIQKGQVIATVGRTGLNAWKKRSPTHLHFSMFSVQSNMPIPKNPYQKLCSAKCVP